MWFWGDMKTFQKFIVLIFALKVYKGCEAITTADFNAQIRDYSAVGDALNLTDVKTLQKHGLGLSRYANFAPVRHPVKFEDVPDSTLSGSSHARGLYNGHMGYGFDYEEPHYGNGYEYPLHDDHHAHDPHDYHHYDYHNTGHHHAPVPHHSYGHHHKHYDHGLATKALLWPIAGIALLGAAAAFVTNPVLLQLGVVSGKRRRRQVEEIENMAKNSIRKWTERTTDNKEKLGEDNESKKVLKNRVLRKDDFKVFKQVQQTEKGVLQFDTVDYDPKRYSEEDRRLIPIPLKFKKQHNF